MAENVETQQTVNAEDFSNWEMAKDPATSCWLPVTQTLPLTLELREPNSSSWAANFWKLGHLEFDMDFPRLHAMLRWLHEELWECTKDFVLKHKLIEMANPLCYAAGSKEAYMLESTLWDKIDERELTDWTFLIGHTQFPDSAFLDGFTTKWGSVDSVTELLRSADEIRHAAAHHRPTSVGDLFQAMLLPRILKDTKRADRIEHTFYTICDEAGSFFDESTRMDAEQTIYTLPCETSRQKLARLESLVQTLYFGYAQRRVPNLLSRRCWVVPERVEISKLSDLRFKPLYQDDFPDERFESESFHETVVALQHLRNQLWHRHPVSDTEFLDFFHAAVRFAIYTANRVGSINIEIEVEKMFTGKSRGDVLARLHRVYQVEELPAEEDDRQRECRRRVAIGKVLEESGIETSSRETFTNWNYMVQYPRPEEPYWEEPCVENSNVPLTNLENDSPWGIDSPWGLEGAVPAGTRTDPKDTFWGEGHLDSANIYSENPDLEHADSDEQCPNQLFSDQPCPDRLYSDQSYPGQSYPDQSYPDQPYPDQLYPDQSYPDPSYPDQSYPDQSYPDQSYPDQPYSEHTDSHDPDSEIQETWAQIQDQHPLKEIQVTVTNIDPTSSPPDSPHFPIQETFDINLTSLTHSPTPASPTAISQSNLTTMTEGEVNTPITQDVLDQRTDRTQSIALSSMKTCERPRLLTFSPSMHECLRW